MSREIRYTLRFAAQGISDCISSVTGLFSRLSALWVANRVWSYGKQILAYAGAIQDASEATGLAAENFQALSNIAATHGVKMEALTGALMRVRDAQASIGTDERAQKVFARLGLSIQQVRDAKPEELLRLIAQRLKETGDVSVATDLFGRGGARMIETMKELGDGWEALRGKTKNALFSRQDIADLEAAADQLERIGIWLKVWAGKTMLNVPRALYAPIAEGMAALTTRTPQEAADVAAERIFGVSPYSPEANAAYLRKIRAPRLARERAAQPEAATPMPAWKYAEQKAEYESHLESRPLEEQIKYWEEELTLVRQERAALGEGEEVLKTRAELTQRIVALNKELRRLYEEQGRRAGERMEEEAKEKRARVEARVALRRYEYEGKSDEEKLAITEQNITRWTARVKQAKSEVERSKAVKELVEQWRERDAIMARMRERDREKAERRAEGEKAKAELKELQRPRSERLDASGYFDWSNFFRGKDPLSLGARPSGVIGRAVGGTLGLPGGGAMRIRRIGESADAYQRRLIEDATARIFAGRSPEEQALELHKQEVALLAVIASAFAE